MDSRRKTLIAGISIVGLLLGIPLAKLFSPGALNERPSGSPAAGTSVTNDLSPTRAAHAPVDDTDNPIASNQPAVEETPLPGSVGSDSGALTGTGAEVYAVEPADSPGQKREARPGTVTAECWGLRGSAPRDYVVTVDREMRTSGRGSALISAQRESDGYVTMFQTSTAAPLRGRRVEFSADVRTRGATGSANLLLRAEDAYGRTVAFDNMQSYGADGRPDQSVNRGVKGNTEWSTQHVVVDIPDEARVITYGVSMFGGGKTWIDNARIEVVTDDMPTTAVSPSPTLLNGIPVNPASLTRRPRNLGFDLEASAGAPPCN